VEDLKLEIVGYRNETSMLCTQTGVYASQANASAQAAAASAAEAGASAEYVSQRIESEVNSALSTHLAGKLDVDGKAVDSAHADNADTVNNHTVLSDVPANAVFTDTTYEAMTAAEATTGTGTTARVITAKVLADKIAEAIASLVDSSPAALDTLNELATALGNDPNFATTMATALGNKLDKAGGTVTGNLTVNGTFTADVTGNADTATKLATARTINIQDSTATNTGTGASFDGSGNATIKLPATINANITGDVTGNAATATKATGDKNGNDITTTYVNLTGAQTISGVKTFTGKPILTNGLSMRVTDTNSTTTRDAQVLHANSSNTEFGLNLAVGGGGNVIVGSGESYSAQLNALAGEGAENLYLISDGIIYLKPNANTFGNAKTIILNTSGELSGLAKVTATTFQGALSGNAATATKINGKTIPVVSSFDSTTGVLALTSLS
jgi:hypothetical protein